LYVTWAWGGCRALWSARAIATADGVLEVDVRTGARACFPGAMAAIATFAAARIELATPVDPSHPPQVVDASGGGLVIQPYQELM
jgi:hypothetical protein